MDETPGEPPDPYEEPEHPELPEEPSTDVHAPVGESPEHAHEATPDVQEGPGFGLAPEPQDADEGPPKGEEHQTQEEAQLPDELPETGAFEAAQLDLDDAPGDQEGPYHTIEETDYHSLEAEVHSAEELRQRRAQERAARKRLGRQRLLALVVGVIVLIVVIVLATSGGGGGKKPPTLNLAASPLTFKGSGLGYLAAGSSPSALSGNILIADRNNDRLLAISPAGQLVWSQHISGPSDAYPSSTARSVVVTEHSNFQLIVLGVAHRSIDYHYGHAHVPGAAANRLHDPSSGQLLPDGRIVVADKSNCRVLLITRPTHHVVRSLGRHGDCRHDPPTAFSYPDSAFPLSDGGLVVSEFTPGAIDLLSSTLALQKSLTLTILPHPMDANQTPSGDLIATDYGRPGAVVELNSSGTPIWTYRPTSGPGELDYPTLAEVLPDGNVLVSDARNDRVIVIDHATKKIIWQYGHTGAAGGSPGYLHTPDTAVLVPGSS